MDSASAVTLCPIATYPSNPVKVIVSWFCFLLEIHITWEPKMVHNCLTSPADQVVHVGDVLDDIWKDT